MNKTIASVFLAIAIIFAVLGCYELYSDTIEYQESAA